MMFRPQILSLPAGLLALSVALLAGCTDPPAATPTDDQGEPQASGAELDPEIEEALAALLPADREAAFEQKVCPVTGKPLGWMGTPAKVTVEGREVFICCEGCEETLRENPEEYLARIPAE